MEALLMNQIYNKVDQKAKAKGSFAQMHTLVLEALVPQNGGSVLFNLSSNVTGRASERKLDPNDAFVVAKMGLFCKQELSTKPGSVFPESYPNQTAFSLEASYVVLADLRSIWNSTLQLKVGDKIFGQAIDMYKSLVIPTTQQTSASTFSERREGEGMFMVSPLITLEGQAKNELRLNIPANGQLIQNSTAGNGLGIYAVLKLEGFLVTNGSGLGQVTNNS